MIQRTCLGPKPGVRCPTSSLTSTTRCPSCETQRRALHSKTYGVAHQAARQRLATTLPRYCAYGCGTFLQLTSKWVAAHVRDGQPQYGWVVACVPCNERAKGYRAVRTPRLDMVRL